MTNKYFSEFDYSDYSGRYFVFDGQNASTGTPNKITGRMSFWGKVYSFDSKEAAKMYEENQNGRDCNRIIVAGTARTMRKYCMGQSLRDFADTLYYAPEA